MAKFSQANLMRETRALLEDRDRETALLRRCVEFWREGTPVYAGSLLAEEIRAYLNEIDGLAS